ncbi:MAG: hypothetical protein KDB03_17005 [Planctomycetales bacterium]|nr:hypothetical protein [Planctomycetales bacterium]
MFSTLNLWLKARSTKSPMRKQRRRSTRRQLKEALETRQLMAVDVSLNNGELNIVGSEFLNFLLD